MIERVNKGEVDGIITWKLDRLARNPVDSWQIQYLLQTTKIKVIITPEREYLQEHAGLLMSVESWMATQFIIDLSKAVHRWLDYKIKNWEFTWFAPEWYINKNNKIEMDPERFDMVKKMWKMMITWNYSATTIADIANTDWGYRTKQWKKLSSSSIYRIFNSIFYTWDMEIKWAIYPAKHKKMISREDYNIVQSILWSKKKAKLVKHDYPYTWVIVCWECWSMITAGKRVKYVKTQNKYVTYSYYWCTKKKNKHSNCCSQKAIPTKDLEQNIMNILKSISIKEDFYYRAVNDIKSRIDYNIHESEQILNNLVTQRNTIVNSIDKLEDMLIGWKISDDKYDLKLKKLQMDLKDIEERISNSHSIESSKFKTFKSILDFSKESMNVFQKWDFQTKKEILKSLGLDYILLDRNLAIELYPWFEEIKKFNQGINQKDDRFGLIKNSTSMLNTNAENIYNSCWQGE